MSNMEYTHWLVTKGRDPLSVPSRGLVPLVLAPKATTDLRQLVHLVRAEVDRRAHLLAQNNASSMDTLLASVRPYVTGMVVNLWVSEVRLSNEYTWFADEEAVRWVMHGTQGHLQDWQGPADGVIPRETPVTIRVRAVEPAPFEILTD
jgi:hypothetical protein